MLYRLLWKFCWCCFLRGVGVEVDKVEWEEYIIDFKIVGCVCWLVDVLLK